MDKGLLVEKVKEKVNITWEDPLTESKINGLIDDAIVALSNKIGADDIDYSKPGQERQLFLNYCLYSYNNCINEFDSNYINDIYQLRIKYEVLQYEKSIQ